MTSRLPGGVCERMKQNGGPVFPAIAHPGAQMIFPTPVRYCGRADVHDGTEQQYAPIGERIH
jgi:hypothetical protein